MHLYLKTSLLVCGSLLCLQHVCGAQVVTDTTRKKPVKMEEVLIKPDGYYYKEDTSNNREVYKKSYRILNDKPEIPKRQPGDMRPGLIVDGLFTRGANNISGRTKKAQQSIDELESDQQKRYVETRYTPQLVYRLTSLTDDTLAHFMNAYPMSYAFATTAKELEFKMWIRANYKDWRAKGSPVPSIQQ